MRRFLGIELWFVILDNSSTFITESSAKKGMSAIAALFMIIFNDEQAAFWALCSFMIKTPWTQKGMFLPGFPKLNHFTSMWEKILETTMPKISRHFEEEGVIPQIYLTKWFLQNFLDRLPFHLCIRLWDLFLLEGKFFRNFFFSFQLFWREIDWKRGGATIRNPGLGSLAAVVARLCKKVVLRAARQIT